MRETCLDHLFPSCFDRPNNDVSGEESRAVLRILLLPVPTHAWLSPSFQTWRNP